VILSVTLPFFALVGLGYLAAWRGWVPTAAVPAFNGFLLFFAVPAMLFRFASNTPFEQFLIGRFALAWCVIGCTIVWGVAWLAHRYLEVAKRDAAFLGLASAIGNLGFMGVPLMVALLGEGAAAALIVAIVIDAVVVGSIGLLMAEMADGSGATARGMQAAVKRVALNPFIVAMGLGILFSGMEWSLPTPIASVLKLLADAAGPCALFAIGVSLLRPEATLRSPLLVVPTLAKLVVHPLVVWLALRAIGVDPYTTLVAVLAAGLPSAGWVFIFAMRYRADAGRISAAILVTTALASATFSGLVWLMGVGRSG
jgi:malonate transporter